VEDPEHLDPLNSGELVIKDEEEDPITPLAPLPVKIESPENV